MARSSKEVDLNKGIIPVNPEAVGVPEEPIILDGTNVMPTELGYESFFGKDVSLHADTLPAGLIVQEVISYRTDAGDDILIALTDQGLLLKTLKEEVSPPVVTTVLETITVTVDQGCDWFTNYAIDGGLWTYALLKNKLYLYQRGLDRILYVYGTVRGEIVFDLLTPTYLSDSTGVQIDINLTVRQESNNSTYKDLTIGDNYFRTNSANANIQDTLDFNNRYVSNINNHEHMEANIYWPDHLESSTPGSYVAILTDIANPTSNPPVLAYETDASPGEITQLDITHNGTNWVLTYAGQKSTMTYLIIRVTNIIDAGTGDLRSWSISMDTTPGEDTNALLGYLGTEVAGQETIGAIDTNLYAAHASYTPDYNIYEFTPDGNYYIHLFAPLTLSSYTLEVVSLATASATVVASLVVVSAKSMAVSPDSSMLAISYVNGNVVIYSLPDLTVLNTIVWALGETANFDGLQFNSASTKLAAINSTSKLLAIYDTTSWTGLATLTNVSKIRFIPGGVVRYAIIRVDGTLEIYDEIANTLYLTPTDQPAGTVYGMKVSPDGTKLALEYLLNVLTVYDTATWADIVPGTLTPTHNVGTVEFSANGLFLVIAGGIQQGTGFGVTGLTLYKFSDWLPITPPGLDWSTTTVYDISLSSNSRTLYVGTQSAVPHLYVINTSDLGAMSYSTLNPMGVFYIGAAVYNCTLSPNADWLAYLAKDDTILIQSLSKLPGAVTTSASAWVQDTIKVRYYAMDAVVPVPAISQDGTETYTINSTTTAVSIMAHIIGISAARGRMAAWDYLNAIYWSDATDVVDFVPSLETRANNLTVDSVAGSIRMLQAYDDGFIILSTGNIVQGKYENTQQVFTFDAIHAEGIMDYSHVRKLMDNLLVWTKSGLLKYNPETGNRNVMNKELAGWLRTRPLPVRLVNLGTRYLGITVALTDPGKLDGRSLSYSSQGSNRPTGSIGLEPYPDKIDFVPIQRMYVYDTVLDRYGIMEGDIRIMFCLDPMNAAGYALDSNYHTTQNIHTGNRSLACIATDGKTYIYNDNPTDSELVLGKYQQSRTGSTRITNVEAEFVDYPDNTIAVETSLDDRTITRVDTSASNTLPNQNYQLTSSGKWFNIVIKGRFNLRRLLLRGYKLSIR